MGTFTTPWFGCFRSISVTVNSTSKLAGSQLSSQRDASAARVIRGLSQVEFHNASSINGNTRYILPQCCDCVTLKSNMRQEQRSWSTTCPTWVSSGAYLKQNTWRSIRSQHRLQLKTEVEQICILLGCHRPSVVIQVVSKRVECRGARL